jgi:Ariadne domain
MARFLHHFQRWNAHADSSALERTMADTVCARLAPVVREAIDFNGNEFIFGGKGLSFIHDAFCELLECRSMLQHTYAFSYFRYQSASKIKYMLLKQIASEKLAFEQFQSELELMTEQISDIVARTHIRATQTQITYLTAAAADKRKEFSNIMINILLQEKKDEDAKKEEESKGMKAYEKRRSSERAASTSRAINDFLGLGSDSDDTSDDDEIADNDGRSDEAVRESLQEFLASTGSSNFLDYESFSDDEDIDWTCPACTFVNAGGRSCEICASPRPS